MIPASEWMTYGDLADAANVVAPDSKTSGPGVASALPHLISIDSRTLAALKTWRRSQAEERLMMGAGWHPGDCVFTWPTGDPRLATEGLILVPGSRREARIPQHRSA